MSEPFVKKKEIVFLFIMIVAIFTVRAAFFHAPLDRDEGANAYMARAVSLGDVPYRDVFDHKPPFVYYLYKTAFSLFGESARAVRVFTAWVVLFTALLLYVFIRTFYSAWVALMAVFLYGLFQHNPLIQGFGSNTGIFAQFPALLALFFLADREKGYEKVSYFITGFFIGVAVYVNLMAGLLVFVPILYMVFYEKKARGRCVLWYFFGFVSVSLLVFLWCVKNGCLSRFVDSVFLYNLFNIKTISGAAVFSVKANLLPAAGLFYSAAVLAKRPGDRVNFLVFISSVLLLSAAVVSKSVIIAVPFLCVPAALMVRGLAEWVKKRAGILPAAAALFMVLFAGSFVFVYFTNLADAFKKGGTAEEALYEARFAGRYIKDRVNEGEKIFVWPNEPEIYFYSKTKPVTRYINAYPFGYYKKDFENVPAALLRVKPRFIVLRRGRDSRVFEGFARQYYSPAVTTNNLEIYEKKGDNNKKD